MRSLIAALLCAAILAPALAAQTPPPAPVSPTPSTSTAAETTAPASAAASSTPPAITLSTTPTYFLIDASGSMKDRMVAADNAVSKVIQKLNPETPVSRTYFRAIDKRSCWTPIELAPQVRAGDSKPEKRDFRDDFTPLGGALESAILAAGSGPAEIVIITDEEQTQDCGIDICAIAHTYLPRKDISVRVEPVGSAAVDHDRLGCIEGAQGRQLHGDVAARDNPKAKDPNTDPAATSDNGGAEGGDEGGDDGEERDAWGWIVHFLETWWWLFGFVLVAAPAVAFAFEDLLKSVKLENEAREARSKQDLIRAGDEKAPSELQKIIDDREEEDGKETKKRAPRWLWLIRRHWIMALGAISLLALAWLPKGWIGAAKDAAWDVLNSEFASAFAITWIAILFFAGSQHQRRREARSNYAIATDEAGRTAKAQKTAEDNARYKAYGDAYDAVDRLGFDDVWVPVRNSEEGPTEADRLNLLRVRDAAVGRALRSKLSQNALPDDLIGETKRLLALVPRQSIFSQKPKMATFVAQIRRDGSIPEDDAEWKSFSEALPTYSFAAIQPPLHALAAKLT